MDFPILSVLALIPVVGAVSLIFLRGALAKQVALAAALGVLVLAVVLAAQFEPGAGMQLTEQGTWIRPLGAYYALGLDGIGLTLVLLVAIVTPLVILASWRDFDDDAVASSERAATSEERALSLSRSEAAGLPTGAGRDSSTDAGRDLSTGWRSEPLRGSGSTL